MTVQELCVEIELQESLAERVMEFILSYDFASINHLIQELSVAQTAFDAYKKLEKVFQEDEDKIKMLSCQLLCAAGLYERYQKKKISHKIYIDTMKCFTRFAEECMVKTGKYAFDRAWWTYRQVSMVLFRIGELEYELVEENGKKAIYLHIPSDASFTKDMVDQSLEMAQYVISTAYPEYVTCDYFCESWLLSPKLKELLDVNSNIIQFQNRFEIMKENKQAKDIFEWLFKTDENTEISILKEDTSLQRKAKQLLLQGENIGIAYGVLKKLG
uniref:acyltransferase domain-containing protein n=1 Tax=Acetatifactor sp. TaxID=1872090 RepID=UPI004056070C